MTSSELKSARHKAGLTQHNAAKRLGVTQPYLSMLERGKRSVSASVTVRVATLLPLDPTSLPLSLTRAAPDEDEIHQQLGALHYPGFAYLRGPVLRNPAELLLQALDREQLDSRLCDGLPWLPLAFPNMNWTWLVREAKQRNRQNRLAYVVELARQAAQRSKRPDTEERLTEVLASLESSRLACEDTLCNAKMTQVERRWLRSHSTLEAQHWNLLSDLKLEHLDHVYV